MGSLRQPSCVGCLNFSVLRENLEDPPFYWVFKERGFLQHVHLSAAELL